jgi:hypothetical protein
MLLRHLYGTGFVFDIHSTTAETDDFIITVGKSLFAEYFPLENVVDMSGIAYGTSLIENVPNGISLEYSRTTDQFEIADQIQQCLINFGFIPGVEKAVQQKKYRVYGILEKTSMNKDLVLENFVETKVGVERFFPILYGEEEYKDIFCMKSHRIE